ncbi:acyl-[acyl-carrier-protein]--UDP-N-acetylglucosamine O-acyltransferase, partial [Mesorhizobium sp. M2A.F.Ca.ET.046.02.1.1]
YLLRKVYRSIFDRSRSVAENIDLARAEFGSSSPAATKMIDFIASGGKRHYAVPPLKGGGDDDSGDDEA